MHELSIVMSIINIAQQQTSKANATIVDEIELDIGTLSGIESNSFEFAWKQAVRGTVLANTVKKINSIKAMAQCLDCDTSFEIKQYYDACPNCGGHLLNIKQGKELKVKSLVVT